VDVPLLYSFAKHLLHAGFSLARLIFDPEYGDYTFLRNVSSHTDYTTVYPEDGSIQGYIFRP
jgi:hypothetical protein